MIKICGLKTPEALEAALSGADQVGFVFFEKSPRHIDPGAARKLSDQVGGRAEKVALTVDADDATIASIVEALAPDWLQLHGAESPERVRALRARFGLPILKAVGVAEKADLARASAYEGVADRLLFDAKPPKGAPVPGGNGLIFDWRLLHGYAARDGGNDWMLSGGLTPQNVGEALRLTGAAGVDVSSGVEHAPGVKSPEKIAAFIASARRAQDELGLAAGSV
jgi:phosphoribosylanthranilate isomerase